MKLLTSALLASTLLSSAAFATDLSQAQTQGQQQVQGQGQIARGGSAKSSSGSISGASNATKVNSSNRNSAASSSASDASSGSSSGGNSSSQTTEGDDTSLDAWGFSYVDSAPQVPQAAVTADVVVTSQNLKVLGPVFGYAWQDLELAPQGLYEMVDLVQLASLNDTTPVGRSQQSAALAVLCTYKPALADARFGPSACDRIGEIVENTK